MFVLKNSALFYFGKSKTKNSDSFKGGIIMTGLLTKEKQDFEFTHKFGFEIYHQDNFYKPYTLYANSLAEFNM